MCPYPENSSVHQFLAAQCFVDLAACRSLGANDFQVFWNVTLPNIRWGLLYGIILTNAVSVGRRLVRFRTQAACRGAGPRGGAWWGRVRRGPPAAGHGAGPPAHDAFVCCPAGRGADRRSCRLALPLPSWLQRAMGEFGAVSVISGNIIGQTQTLTLFVESAYKVGKRPPCLQPRAASGVAVGRGPLLP